MQHVLRRPIHLRPLFRAPLFRRSFVRPSNATAGNVLDPRLKKGDKVVMAMSGGVDSSVSLRLLAEHELSLSAVFMRNWTPGSSDRLQGCEWEKDWEDVQLVCKALDIPCQMIDLSQQYWTRVFEPAIDSWSEGLTPNPDISCNKEIKFGALMNRVLTDPSAYLATGHYARILQNPLNGRPQLLHARDTKKDQSYFLSSCSERQFSRAIFPLGNYLKSEVKSLAKDFALPTAERSESMGICFVEPSGRFPSFLAEYIPSQPGRVVDDQGREFGTHEGLWTYTVGQRYKVGGRTSQERLYVAGKRKEKNEVVVVRGSDHPLLYPALVPTHSWSFISSSQPSLSSLASSKGLPVTIKASSALPRVPATLFARGMEGEFDIRLDPVDEGSAQQGSGKGRRGNVMTPGQTVVAWIGDWCIGGGIIAERELG